MSDVTSKKWPTLFYIYLVIDRDQAYPSKIILYFSFRIMNIVILVSLLSLWCFGFQHQVQAFTNTKFSILINSTFFVSIIQNGNVIL